MASATFFLTNMWIFIWMKQLSSLTVIWESVKNKQEVSSDSLVSTRMFLLASVPIFFTTMWMFIWIKQLSSLTVILESVKINKRYLLIALYIVECYSWLLPQFSSQTCEYSSELINPSSWSMIRGCVVEFEIYPLIILSKM